MKREDRHQAVPMPSQIYDPCAALRRASRAVSHLYDLILSPTGLKCTQFTILHAVHQRGEIAQWQLADNLATGDDTLSRRLATLRRAGLIHYREGRIRPGEKVYSLTPGGLEKYRQALPFWIRAQERLRLVMGDEQWDALIWTAHHVVMYAQQAEIVRVCNVAPAQPPVPEREPENNSNSATA